VGSINTRARLHQRVFGAHFAGGHGAGTQPRLRLGHALGGQGVAAQIGIGAVVVEPIGVVELLEHARHARWRKARLAQHRKADAIGLTLHVAREVELALHRRRLPAQDGGLRGIGAAALGGRQDAEDQAGQREHALALVGGDTARDVALRDVRQLVRQHRSQLVGRAGEIDQRQMHADITAGQRERVDASIAHQERLERESSIDVGRDVAELARSVHQRLPDRLQILQQHGIVEVVGVAPDLSHDLLANPLLGRHRDLVGSRFAQRRQLHLRPRRRRERERQAQHGGNGAPRQRAGVRGSRGWAGSVHRSVADGAMRRWSLMGPCGSGRL
jgi:hypothetical protein